MRAALVSALKADAGVADVCGARIYTRRGALGGISRDLTPEAFTSDGDLRPSIVVILESRQARPERAGKDMLVATQVIACWCYQQSGYDEIGKAVRALKRLLSDNTDLRPLEDTHIRWAKTSWATDSQEQIDPALELPVVAVRFEATLTETLT